MTTARDIMTADPMIVGTGATITEIATMLRDEGVGAVIVCNHEHRLQGMVTDRDVAVEIVANRRDPETTYAGDIITADEVVTIGADDLAEEAVRTMQEHAVRRLPVIDGDRVVGIVSQADLPRSLSGDAVRDLLRVISESGDNSGSR